MNIFIDAEIICDDELFGEVDKCKLFLRLKQNGTFEKVIIRNFFELELTDMLPMNNGDSGLFAIDEHGERFASILYSPTLFYTNDKVIGVVTIVKV